MGYSWKKTDNVINPTTNILCEMNYRIVYVLSFRTCYITYINYYIDYQFIIPSSTYSYYCKNQFYCYSFDSIDCFISFIRTYMQ